MVRAHGERIRALDHHRLTFDTLGRLAGERWSDTAAYFQACRRRRNVAVYERAGVVSQAEAEELHLQVKRLRDEIVAWLRLEKPELAP